MNLPKRKSPRLKGYDYSTPGYYFTTICTHNKVNILSRICTIQDNNVGAIHESPETLLTPQGKIVDDIICNIPEHFGVTIDKYVIMPNHIHLIIVIEDNEHSRAIRESPLRKRDIIEMVVGYIKMNSSKAIHNNIFKGKVWQRSFHDHIIRGEKDYLRIWEYVDTNPAKWKQDCFYTG